VASSLQMRDTSRKRRSTRERIILTGSNGQIASPTTPAAAKWWRSSTAISAPSSTATSASASTLAVGHRGILDGDRLQSLENGCSPFVVECECLSLQLSVVGYGLFLLHLDGLVSLRIWPWSGWALWSDRRWGLWHLVLFLLAEQW
jgi:hypothetical protein